MSIFLVVDLKIDRNICSYTVELSYTIIKGTEKLCHYSCSISSSTVIILVLFFTSFGL
jgi:hypothetical protein